MVDTTLTTLTELVNSESINDVIQEALRPFVVASPYALWADISDEATLTKAFPRYISDDAAVEEPAEGTGLTAVALETEEASPVTVGQMGLARTFTRRSLKNTKRNREQLLQFAVMDASRALALALDDDVCALFPSFTSSVGATGTDLSLANMAAAVGQLGIDDANIPGRKVFVLHGVQNSDLLQAYVASAATAVNDFYERGSDDGRQSGSFMGIPIKFTSQCDTANLGADRVGGLFADGMDPMNEAHATVGIAFSQMPESYADTDVLAGGDVDVSVVADWAAGMIHPTRGVAIITDA
jgi:hypothetical protein